MSIKADEFSLAVSKMLDDYNMQVKIAVAKSVEKTGEKAKKAVKARSPVRKGKGGGRYKKGWRIEKHLGGLFMDQAHVTIYNKTDGPLVHLLEYGHQIARYPDSPGGRARKGYQKVVGGRVEGIPHVRPAYEEAERLLPDLTAKAIEEAGEK